MTAAAQRSAGVMKSGILTIATLLVSTIAVVTGCGAQVAGTPRAGEIDVRPLDVGNYPVAPIDSTQEYHYDYDSGKSAAAIRLGNHMIIGLDIDPKLRYNTGFAPIIQESDSRFILSNAAADAAMRNNIVYGMSYGTADMAVGSQNAAAKNANLVTLTIMQFKSSKDADQAATQIEHADFDTAPDKNRTTTLDKYPGAHTHWQTSLSTMESTIARGQYVMNITAQLHGGDLSALTSTVTKSYDKQLALLDSLPPLAPIDILKLPPDPDGILRRLLNPDKIWQVTTTGLASYDLQGFLHFPQDEESAKKVYESLHIEKFGTANSYSRGAAFYNPPGFGRLYTAANGKTMEGDDLYRSPDETAARDVWTKILNAPDTAMAPTRVPNSKCAELPSEFDMRNFTCTVRYRQYVGVVWANQLSDAQQRAAAQYALLANSQWM